MKAWREVEPDIVLIEGHSFASKGNALTVLHELHGVVKHRLFLKDAPYVYVAPPSLKLAATGNGRADKEMMLAAARKRWPECAEHNQADALHLAVYGIRNYSSLASVE